MIRSIGEKVWMSSTTMGSQFFYLESGFIWCAFHGYGNGGVWNNYKGWVMDAIEFVKKHGLEHSKDVANGWITNYEDIDLNDLKQIIEAFELVESYKSRFGDDAEWFFVSDYCKKNRISPFFNENYDRASCVYKQAIELVEKCNASD